LQSWLVYLEERYPGILEISTGAFLALVVIILIHLVY